MTRRIIHTTLSKETTLMFDKAFDNMQEIGKQWAAFGRKVTRGALEATSSSLESAAKYLKDLREKVVEGNGQTPSDHDAGSRPADGHGPDNGASA